MQKPRAETRGLLKVDWIAVQIANRTGKPLCLLLFVDVLFSLQGMLKILDAFSQTLR